MRMKFVPPTRGHTGMRLIFALLFALAALPASAEDEHVHVALLSEQDALVPGTTAWLGLRLTHDPHWHTYWINPGDSGLPTKLAWQLPAGFHAGEIAWPTPQRIRVGDLYNFGYEGDVLLPVPIEVPADAKAGANAHLAVTAKWLVCHEQCIPGKADLALELPLRDRARKSNSAALFDAARAAMPGISTTPVQARHDGEQIRVNLPSIAAGAGLDAFAQTHNVLANAPPRVAPASAGATLTFASSEYATTLPATFDLLVLRPGEPALLVRAILTDSVPQ